MIHFYTGNGKGKTTAAIGQSVRGAGNGLKIVFAQFMENRESGEWNILEKLKNVKIYRVDKEFTDPKALSEADRAALTDIHNQMLDTLLAAAKQASCGMIVLDDIVRAVQENLLDEEKLKKLLKYGDKKEIILTGSERNDYFVEKADYITHMGLVSHPCSKGAGARKGVEY